METIRPMLAALEPAPLRDPGWVYEPKYDGIRALIEVEPGRAGRGVRIWSRLGGDKTPQFPEIVAILDRFRRRLKAPVILDGEIVALDDRGQPAGFQQLQSRIHLIGAAAVAEQARRRPAALIAFDVLRDGHEDLRPLPLALRRARLERILRNAGSPTLRLSDFVPGDGSRLLARAAERGQEGLVAKVLDSPYRSGRRTPEWRKVKIVQRQECVVGGWTEPRHSRAHFGALLLGVYDDRALVYVGHTGTGFTGAELVRVSTLLRDLETSECPFSARPPTNERPHWVRPRLVAEVAFTEWTAEGKLRHPAYLGLRDDVDPRAVGRERGRAARTRTTVRRRARRPTRQTPPALVPLVPALARLVSQLEDIEDRGGTGTLTLPDGGVLSVSHLRRTFFPGPITKGELMRYYVSVSPVLLPAVADRPLITRRFPNGIAGTAFYQQRAPDPVPAGVRVARLPSDRVVPSRLIGGSLLTLLYTTQMAVISQDPWFSRVQSPDDADHAAFDLDPMPGVPFARVRDVARWLRDELATLGIPNVPKTSGVAGVHIYVPLPPRTSYATGRLFCELVATLVAHRHPAVATLARAVRARGRRVYIDCLQNSRGKTLATAYSARATTAGSVSTPLTWSEMDAPVDPRDFTLRSLPARLARVGDLWAPLRQSRGADLAAALRAARGP